MRDTRLTMGMPVTVELVDRPVPETIDAVFAYFDRVDRRFSPFRSDSELEAFNRAELSASRLSQEMKEVFALADQTRRQTGGFFDIRRPDGRLDPCGIVKGWAIRNAARIIERSSCTDYFVDAGGDIQSGGHNGSGKEWSVGIRNPFCQDEIIKVVYPRGRGIATSGSYVRGDHIYNPHCLARPLQEIVSLTVIGPDVLEADRFATAAFAMGRDGIAFIEQTPGLEGYQVDAGGRATMTSGFEELCRP